MTLYDWLWAWFNPLPPSDAVQQQKKNILEDLFSSVLSQFKKYPSSGNLKFNYLGNFQSLKLRILMKKSFHFSYAEFRSKYFGLLWVYLTTDFTHTYFNCPLVCFNVTPT